MHCRSHLFLTTGHIWSVLEKQRESNMSETPMIIELPSQPTTDDVVGLLEQLCSNTTTPVEFSAERVKVVTSLELQILIAAKAQWDANGTAFSITAPSEAFRSGLMTLGHAVEHLDEKAVQ